MAFKSCQQSPGWRLSWLDCHLAHQKVVVPFWVRGAYRRQPIAFFFPSPHRFPSLKISENISSVGIKKQTVCFYYWCCEYLVTFSQLHQQPPVLHSEERNGEPTRKVGPEEGRGQGCPGCHAAEARGGLWASRQQRPGGWLGGWSRTGVGAAVL